MQNAFPFPETKQCFKTEQIPLSFDEKKFF